ncbi:membrane protein [Nocardia neocaledoniensis NBRC 108232]|uniref:Transporter family-2 protein n=1 Tax=Nocardia neocaledoniensis TaxID=236511 RepID=A0A317NNP2_9NOCA|nr:DMT family transporter [Nocardia neocaledoniensis]PWV76413.1 transporter family-2 protein [Nocardia neocaledoniensis]GEM34685.1 membrane protein [Nocardia neocaledoniensis NBRC 108232]
MVGRNGLGAIFGFCIGAGVAVQGRINGALGAELGDGVAAATISFGTGLLVLLVAFAASPSLRAGLGTVRTAVADGRVRPWQLLGGLCGAFFVASQGLTIAAIGVTAFTVAVVAGQLLSSLVVDRLGLAPNGRTPVTTWRVVAAVLGIAGVVLSAGSAATPTGSGTGVPGYLLIVLPALAGIGLAWQQAVNGRVGAVGGPFPATLINFTVGLIALCLFNIFTLLSTGLPTRFPTAPWLYLGGLIGVAFIALAAITVGMIGVLLLGLTSVAGQLIAAMLLDAAAGRLSLTAVGSCAIVLTAVVIGSRATTTADH